MKIAKFHVSEELLLDLLALPEGTRIIDIRVNENISYGMSFTFTVGSEQLKDVVKGETIPIIRPNFETTIGECGHKEKVELKDWGYS